MSAPAPSQRRPRRRARQGVTLIELLLFSAVGLLVVSLCWGMVATSLRRGRATDAQLDGTEAALVALGYLERDLRALHEDPRRPLRWSRDAAGVRLRFHRLGPTSAEARWEPLSLVRIEYELDRERGHLTRRVDGREAQVLDGIVDLDLARPGASPAAGPTLVFTLAAGRGPWLGDGSEPADPASRDRRVVLRGAVRDSPAQERTRFPALSRNPYGPSA